ncbi:hypothetical protein [Symbioplanes lichenis]|uniref:hypothetical protein n=1 Tax=Symbioplanes lichenis TaxID=1629072 RepID=UPI00273901F7|nr:hypothetical protein [Actinoplanes lichenis]
MQITSSAVSLTVADVPASSKFLARHLGDTDRLFKVTDPNGVRYELASWVSP